MAQFSNDNFTKFAIERGGKVVPLLIPLEGLGPSLTNPSILTVGNRVIVNLRNTNYILYHSEKARYEHCWGPLSYIHPENDQHLRTTNVICELDGDLTIQGYKAVYTKQFDKDPKWEFVGLEDGRLVHWDDKLYLIGVRRDTRDNGEGRMELSELEKTSYRELSRVRIPAPGDDSTYCEKNWMPILDKPFEFVKWSNPLELVRYSLEDKTCKTIHRGQSFSGYNDWRGGSQVIPLGDSYIALVHEADLHPTETKKKNGVYRHRFLVWDKDWNLVKISQKFSFLNTNIEFCCGMTYFDNHFLITAGIQDNAAILLKVPGDALREFVYE